jgi:hypothetical protein
MQVIVHKLDWYTRIILTIIALTLLGMVFKPLFISPKVTASANREVLDVNLNIDKVGGEKILRWWEGERTEKGIPIYIDGRIITQQSE